MTNKNRKKPTPLDDSSLLNIHLYISYYSNSVLQIISILYIIFQGLNDFSLILTFLCYQQIWVSSPSLVLFQFRMLAIIWYPIIEEGIVTILTIVMVARSGSVVPTCSQYTGCHWFESYFLPFYLSKLILNIHLLLLYKFI